MTTCYATHSSHTSNSIVEDHYLTSLLRKTLAISWRIMISKLFTCEHITSYITHSCHTSNTIAEDHYLTSLLQKTVGISWRIMISELFTCEHKNNEMIYGHAHSTSDSLILMSHAYNHFRWFACHITSVCCHFSLPLFFSYPSSYAKLGKKTFN